MQRDNSYKVLNKCCQGRPNVIIRVEQKWGEIAFHHKKGVIFVKGRNKEFTLYLIVVDCKVHIEADMGGPIEIGGGGQTAGSGPPPLIHLALLGYPRPLTGWSKGKWNTIFCYHAYVFSDIYYATLIGFGVQYHAPSPATPYLMHHVSQGTSADEVRKTFHQPFPRVVVCL